ncbi:hypothetical protein C4552_04330 [Candidatus Parcubacteria bacterium]|nr:MAG: hypothetical protein C4552_04330 [Candidatus Parcubacteria bacterium]
MSLFEVFLLVATIALALVTILIAAFLILAWRLANDIRDLIRSFKEEWRAAMRERRDSSPAAFAALIPVAGKILGAVWDAISRRQRRWF